MRILPVLDIMNGLVVQAIAGKRELYRPITESLITHTPDPNEVLRNLFSMGFREVYIADLDAIMGRGDNYSIIVRASSMGFHVYADIGRRGMERDDENNISFVIGTEYILFPSEIVFQNNRVASLDVFGNNVKYNNVLIPIDIALREMLNRNVNPQKLLLICLDRVGTLSGPNIEVIKIVRNMYRGELIVGGGIRDENDILMLKREGVDGVLVASALHKGLIKSIVY